MNLRLLPVLLIAASGLLTLKLVGLALDGGYVFSAVHPAMAQKAEPETPAAEPAARDPLAASEDPLAGAQPQPLPEGAAPDMAATFPPGRLELGGSPAERRVLESLSDRRRDLDKREKQHDLREQLLKAAEERIDKKVQDLQALETRLKQIHEAEKRKEEEELRGLVTMYEAMKPKDAARIFDRLDLDILLKVSRRMKPRKMADVMARMSPDVAERLTVALAGGALVEPEPAQTAELPKIHGN